MRAYILLISFIAITLAPAIYAEEPEQAAELGQTTDQVEIIRRVENVESNFNYIKDSIFWSLATLAFIAVLLITYNWVTGFHLLQKEKQKLYAEVEQMLETARSDIAAQAAESRRSVTKQFDDLSVTLFKKLKDMRKELSDQICASSDSVRDEIGYEINHIKAEVFELEAKYWESIEVHVNAIDAWIQSATYAHQIGFDTTRKLDSIEKLIAAYYKNSGRKLDPGVVGDIEKLLKTVGSSSDMVGRRILSLLENAT